MFLAIRRTFPVRLYHPPLHPMTKMVHVKEQLTYLQVNNVKLTLVSSTKCRLWLVVCCWLFVGCLLLPTWTGRFWNTSLSRCFSGRALGPFAFSAWRCGWWPKSVEILSFSVGWLWSFTTELALEQGKSGSEVVPTSIFATPVGILMSPKVSCNYVPWGKNMKSQICWGTSFVACRDLQATRPLVRRHASLDGRSQRFGHL